MKHLHLLLLLSLAFLATIFIGCTSNVVTYEITGARTVTAGSSITLDVNGSNNTMPENITWQSSDENIAIINDEGVLTAVSAGVVTITATFKEGSASCSITVEQGTEVINFEGYSAIAIGESGTWVALNAVGTVSWSSSNDAILASDGDGVFHGVAKGTATITARTATQIGTMEVEVTEDLYLTLANDVIDIYTGKTATITYDTNSTTFITFHSSNRSVATVDTNGLITALSEGFATITVRSGNLTAEAYVTVKDKTYAVTVDGKTRKAIEGETITSLLTRIYGTIKHDEKTGYNFIGWYLDDEYAEEANLEAIIYEGLTLYARYAEMTVKDYDIQLNAVLREDSPFLASNDVQAFTADWSAKTGRDLKNYDLYSVSFNLSMNVFTIDHVYTDKTDEKRNVSIPQNGFVIAIKNDAEKAALYRTYLTLGTKIGLSSYSIIKSSYFTVNPKLASASNAVSLGSGSVTARYSAIYDASSATLLWDKSGTAKAYPASMTKMMTAITALRFCSLDDTITIGSELDVMREGNSPSTAGLVKGQTWTLRELLYALLLPSGNDAAYSIAALTIKVLKQGSGLTMRQKIDLFCDYMNETANMMKLVNTHFAVPDGNSYYKADGSWDDRLGSNYSCANDMAVIGSYCLRHAALAIVMDTANKSFTIDGRNYSWNNTNRFVRTNAVLYVGCKTGTTNWAGPCVTIARWSAKKLIITVVMYASSSPNRYTDATTLYDAYDAAQ